MHLEEARHRRLRQIRFIVRGANEVFVACMCNVGKNTRFSRPETWRERLTVGVWTGKEWESRPIENTSALY